VSMTDIISQVSYWYSSHLFRHHCALHIPASLGFRFRTTSRAQTREPCLVGCQFDSTNNSNESRFSAFQVVSAYTNSGMSLVDQSMIPFRTAYLMIVAMIFLILAGNTCFVGLESTNSQCYADLCTVAYFVSLILAV